MFRKTKILNLLFVLALFSLAACTSQVTTPAAVTALPSAEESPTTVETPTPTVAATQTPEPEPSSSELAACTGPVELTPEDGKVTYQEVQFLLDPELGFNFTVQECEAGVEEGTYNPVYPEHLVFKSDSPLPKNFVRPEIRIYKVPADPQPYTYPLNSLAELQQVLEERSEPSPWFSLLGLHTGEKYLDSHSVTGVRALVGDIQDPFFWTNHFLQYTYNGLTDDGRYFISARFPLRAPFLMDIQGADPLSNTNPEAIPLENWPGGYEQQRQVIDEYNQEVICRFEGSSPYDFTPNYELYDALMMSLQVGVKGTAASTNEAVCFTPAETIPVGFTPDGQSLLVREAAGVHFFNLDTLKEERLLQSSQNIYAAALSPAGDTLAWSMEDNTIQLVRVSDGKVLQTLSGHTQVVNQLRFSPDGEQLVSAAHDYSSEYGIWKEKSWAYCKPERSWASPSPLMGAPWPQCPSTAPYRCGTWKHSRKSKIWAAPAATTPPIPTSHPMESW